MHPITSKRAWAKIDRSNDDDLCDRVCEGWVAEAEHAYALVVQLKLMHPTAYRACKNRSWDMEAMTTVREISRSRTQRQEGRGWFFLASANVFDNREHAYQYACMRRERKFVPCTFLEDISKASLS